MDILTTPADMQRWAQAHIARSSSIGFVPTMGALHQGHVRLLSEAEQHNDLTVLSIFVNPMQFNNADDFNLYPRTTETDLEIAQKNSVACVYLPSVDAMYPPGSTVVVEPGSAAKSMEGAMRPGHFRGVTTVVAKLFHAVLPHRAYFGKKDYQQLAVIRQMVNDLDFPLEIVGVDTVREQDGLALSSRNVRLSAEARKQATILFEALQNVRQAHVQGETSPSVLTQRAMDILSSAPMCRTEYADVVHPVSLQPIYDTKDGAVLCVAAWFDDVRLIDNIELPVLH